MARKPRIDIPGYYHIINRGVNRQTIFLDNEDKETFLGFLELSRDVYQFTVHSFCIMDNHYHLLVETTRDNLSLAIRYINSRYAAWFNKKYSRVGPLWQGRFKSWYIHNEEYLWLLIRYIEMNPVKAGLVNGVGDFPFSSSFSVFSGKELPVLTGSCLYFKDLQDWLSPLKMSELEKLADYQGLRMEKESAGLKIVTRHDLDTFFQRNGSRQQRNYAIYQAYKAGHSQADISTYTGLSPAAVSRIVDQVRQAVELFHKLRDKGLFWSYSRAIEFSPDKQDLLIETALKFSDIDDIRQLLKIYGTRVIYRVWNDHLKDDPHFKKLNYFLARIFFNLRKQGSGVYNYIGDWRPTSQVEAALWNFSGFTENLCRTAHSESGSQWVSGRNKDKKLRIQGVIPLILSKKWVKGLFNRDWQDSQDKDQRAVTSDESSVVDMYYFSNFSGTPPGRKIRKRIFYS